MKRLQLRHHDGQVFANKSQLSQFFADIVNSGTVRSTQFGTTLYGEPLVAEYYDEDGKLQTVLAIGKSEDGAEYHVIDSAFLQKGIDKNASDIANINASMSENSVSIALCDHALDSNVRAEYVLKNGVGTVLGEHIKIYKDNEFLGLAYGFKGATGAEQIADGYRLVYDESERDESYKFIYAIFKNSDGELKLAGVDITSLLGRNDFGDGLKVGDDGKIAVALASTDEGFLSVGSDGIKTNGIQSAIDSKAQELISASSLSLKDITDTMSDSSLKSAYALVKPNGDRVGDIVKVYKEGSLKTVTVGTVNTQIDPNTGTITNIGEGEPALVFVYATSEGYQIARIAISDYFTENIFADGLSTAGNVVSVKKAAGSEDYLQIDTAGIAIVGVSGAITTAKNAAVSEAEAYTDEKVGLLSGASKDYTDNLIPSKILYGGLPVGDLTVEEARQSSLVRQLLTSDGVLYFVSSSAKDLYYETASGNVVNLNEYVTGLENRVASLEASFSDLINGGGFKEIIREYLEGTEREIKLTPSEDKLKIGFADNAIFGEYLLHEPDNG